MAYLHLQGRDSFRMSLVVIAALIFGLMSCVFLGHPLYWRLVGNGTAGAFESCPTCACDCDEVEFDISPKKIVADSNHIMLRNCSRNDPDMQEELKKNRIQLLEEELKLQDIVSKEAQKRINAAINAANSKTTQHFEGFQRCNVEMVASEGSRERTEADIVNQRKNTNLWESRARSLGWKGEENDSLFTSNKVVLLDNANTAAENADFEQVKEFRY